MRYRVCSVHGCPELFDQSEGSRCSAHRTAADRARGSSRQRGYDREHESRFRPQVLKRDPTCVVCHLQPSSHADHYPLDRRALVARGLDANDPRHGRGLCQPCHSVATAAHQPGGWNARG